MKVLYILHSARLGGATISFIQLVQALAKDGVQPVVVIPEDSSVLVDVFNRDEIKYYFSEVVESVYPSLNPKHFLSLVLFLPRILHLFIRKYRSLKTIRKIVNNEKPDIIQSNVGVIHEGYKCARLVGVPHVWHLREYQDLDFSWLIFPSKSSFIRKLRGSYVVTITNDIQNHFNLSDYLRARTIYNGVYNERQLKPYKEKDEYFLCCSRISHEKGIEDVIVSFSLFLKNKPSYRLRILGDGDLNYISDLKDLANNNNCGDSIDWLGFQHDVFPHLERAKAIIVASYCEGFGRMTAEACFAGCLVIGRNTGGTKEILNETGGYLFNNIEELVFSMNDIIELSQSEYKEKADKAQSVAIKKYSIEACASNFLSLYEDIVSKRL